MLQHGNGFSIVYNDGSYERWTDYDKAVFFELVKDAFKKFQEIKATERHLQDGDRHW